MTTEHAWGRVGPCWDVRFPSGFFITLPHSRTQLCTNTIRQLSRKENWADAADNLWFMALIIEEKQRLFLLTPEAPTVNPEQAVGEILTWILGKDLWSRTRFLEEKPGCTCTRWPPLWACIYNSWTCVATVCLSHVLGSTDELALPEATHLQALWESADEVKIFTDYRVSHEVQSWSPPGPPSSCGLTARCASGLQTLLHYSFLLSSPSLHRSVCSAASHCFCSSPTLSHYLSISALVLNH